jgi:glycosyltransferase involved in cell wall biosynthesis
MSPGTTLYRRSNYSFDAQLSATSPAQRAGIWRSIKAIATFDYDVLELNEPLWVRRWTVLIPYVVTFTVRRALGRRQRRRKMLVSYAMENSDIPKRLQEHRKVLGRFYATVARILFPALAGRFDRIAFATSQSLDLYRSLGLPDTVQTGVFWPIPATCSCMAVGKPNCRSLTFVSSLEPHKGVDLMMDAGREPPPAVKAGAVLNVIGKGSLEARVLAEAKIDQSIRVYVDPDREQIHTILRESTAVVLLSRPGRYWREQVGLPILEGLAHGCRVIASNETGLTPWLVEHGHEVIDWRASAQHVAQAFTRALSGEPLCHTSGQGHDGPQGRALADSWLVGGLQANSLWAPTGPSEDG